MSADLLAMGRALARLGEPHSVLLSGPDGAEGFAAHRRRMGPLHVTSDLVDLIGAAELRGRGGGGFPFARKLRTVLRMGSEPIVVVNGSEGEPASRKDWLLLTTRPHLVLDGAAAAAGAIGARTVVIHLHAEAADMVAAVRAAIAERWTAAGADPSWWISLGPGGYVAGESSAVLSQLEGGAALPRWSSVPAAQAGYRGRPTLLSNAETFAHVAVLARGLAWPSPFLVTVRGLAGPTVVEVVGAATVGELLYEYGALREPPPAVLVGGYAGRWVDGPQAWSMRLEPEGCGLIAALPPGACGLAETARLARWMSSQGAGQCGPCFLGLPRLADALDLVVRGRRAAVVEVERLLVAVDGRGACAHPDGVARLVRSAMATFRDELPRHHKLHRAGCRPGGFPLPEVRT